MNAPRTCWRASIASCFLPSLVWAVIFGTLCAGFPLPWSVFAKAKPIRPKNPDAARTAAAEAPNDYAGSAACARCHQAIYREFSRTRMGRSLTPVTPEVLHSLPLPGSYYNRELDRRFETFVHEGKLFQSEYQTDADGKEVFRDTHQVQWVIGAGANGFGGLVERGEYLVEAPLSYYQRLQGWGPSPGYESRDLAFTRPIEGECISCHSGRPQLSDAATGKFESKPFQQVPIGCENCHGPGEAHIKAESAPNSALGDAKIVNPGKLSAGLENDICMSCHEGGDSRVFRPGKSYQDFRPGTPLDDTLSIFVLPLKRGDPDESDHVQHYFEMSMSKCYRATAGQLRCATCHNPHVEPTKEEAPTYFNAKCMNCHAGQTCTLAVEERHKTTPADNCIGCHMPERNVPEIAHTSLTNHRILARPGEPWPDEAYQSDAPSAADLLHIDRVPGRTEEISNLTRLEAYRQISERKPEYQAASKRVLTELEQSDPDDAVVQVALGRNSLGRGETQQAIAYFQHALELDPQQPLTYSYLSEALAQSGRTDEAIAASEKAISLDPYDALLQKALINHLIAARQYDKAVAAMEHYMELFPEDDFMRKMLKIAKE